MKTNLIILFVLSLVFSACGSGGGSSNGGNTNSGNDPVLTAQQKKCAETPSQGSIDIRYVYSETINGSSCTTNCQIFTSEQSYCNGLKNEQLNNGCASDRRNEAYQKDCI